MDGRMNNNPSNTRRGQASGRERGASLIEVLIAVLVLAIGALGVAAMQAISLRNSQSALERTQAAVAAYSILDTMRANRQAAAQGLYNTARTCEVPASNGSLVGSDLNLWFTELQSSVKAGACATVTCNGDTCEVVIEWNDERGTGGAEDQTITIRSRI